LFDVEVEEKRTGQMPEIGRRERVVGGRATKK